MIRPNYLESDSVASGPQSKVASANKAGPRYDPPGYAELLSDLKNRIARARIAARTAVNREIIFLYWQIGQEILARQKELGWGAKVIDRLSADLRHAFPEASGFSSRNLKYMRRLAAAYEQEEFVQQVVAQIPWGHHTVLLDRVASPAEREWYAGQIIEHGWSRAVLRHHISTNLFSRQGQAVTNFERTLVPPQSDLAAEMLKDPYHLEFLDIGASARERDLERALLRHLRDFLLELGVGFALVGSQYGLEVGGQDYRIDLLFYHLRLRCFVAVELKVGPFQPEHAGKMNFYLCALDEHLRRDHDEPSIGLILCKERNRVVVEYALRGSNRPIGVAAFRLTSTLPPGLRGSLPSPEELQRGLESGA